MVCSPNRSNTMKYYLFNQKQGREGGFGLALIRRPSFILQVRCVSGSKFFSFPQLYAHDPKVSYSRSPGLIQCLQLYSCPSVAPAEVILPVNRDIEECFHLSEEES